MRQPTLAMRGILCLLVCIGAMGSAYAQGRYTPQGAAQRAWQSGEQLREAGDALRRRKKDKAARAKYLDAIEAFADARKADPAYIDVYVKLGLLYFSVGQPKEALPILEAGLKREPRNVDLQFWYGQNLLAAGKAAQGVSQLESLAQVSDRYPEVHLVLGDHHYGAKAYAKAAPALERYLTIKPEATAARARLGNTYFKLKLYPKALQAFETVRAAWPNKVQVQVNIGNCYLSMGEYQKAVAELQTALKKDPDRASALFNLGLSHFKLGDFKAARGPFERYTTLDAKSFNGHYFLGSTLMELREDPAAIKALQAAHTRKPKIVNPIYKVGLIHLRNRRTNAATTALMKAKALKPKDPWVISALGTVERQVGNTRKALALHSEAAGLLPKNARLQANLALTASAAGSLEVAAAAIDKALATPTTDAWVRSAAARVLALVARSTIDTAPAEARRRLDQALTLVPDDPRLLTGRALARLATGDAAGALTDAKAASAALPADLAVRSTLGRALLETGDADGAVKAFEAVHAKRQSASSAGDLGAALIALGRIDDAIALLDSKKAWRSDAVVTKNRALARYARAMRDLPGGGAQRRVAADLRIVLGVEKSLPRIVAARARYAAAVNALRRGDGREGRAHLNLATGHARAARKQSSDAKYLRGGAGAAHIDFLIAFSDALQKRYGAVKERLARRTSGLDKRLLRYVFGREGALHFRSGNLKKAKAAFDAAAELSKDPTIEHNRLVVTWQQSPRSKRATEGWRRLQRKVPEAIFNLGVAHEAAGDQKKAWKAFSEYAKTKRAHAAKAREIADVKQRIYRFAEGE